MKELVRDLGNPRSTLARLFHWDIKRLVVKALDLLASMPELAMDDFEHYNSREFLNLRNELLYHDTVPRQQRHFNLMFNFFIMLYDSDEYYRQRIDWLIRRLKEMPLKEGEPVRPEWWRE